MVSTGMGDVNRRNGAKYNSPEMGFVRRGRYGEPGAVGGFRGAPAEKCSILFHLVPFPIWGFCSLGPIWEPSETQMGHIRPLLKRFGNRGLPGGCIDVRRRGVACSWGENSTGVRTQSRARMTSGHRVEGAFSLGGRRRTRWGRGQGRCPGGSSCPAGSGFPARRRARRARLLPHRRTPLARPPAC